MPTHINTGEHTVEIAEVVQGNDFCKPGDIVILRWDIYVAGRYDHVKDETNIVAPIKEAPESEPQDIEGVEQKSYLYHVPEYGILAKAKSYDEMEGGEFILDDGREIGNVCWEPIPGHVLGTPRKPEPEKKSAGGIIMVAQREADKLKPFTSKILVSMDDELEVGDEVLVDVSRFTPILHRDMILINKEHIILKYA